jgi:hypothetical protein
MSAAQNVPNPQTLQHMSKGMDAILLHDPTCWQHGFLFVEYHLPSRRYADTIKCEVLLRSRADSVRLFFHVNGFHTLKNRYTLWLFADECARELWAVVDVEYSTVWSVSVETNVVLCCESAQQEAAESFTRLIHPIIFSNIICDPRVDDPLSPFVLKFQDEIVAYIEKYGELSYDCSVQNIKGLLRH